MGPFTLKDFDEYTNQNKRLKNQFVLRLCPNRDSARKDLRSSTQTSARSFCQSLEKFGEIKSFSDLTKKNLSGWKTGFLKMARYKIDDCKLPQANEGIHHTGHQRRYYFHIESNPYNFKVARQKSTEIRFLTEEELKAVEERRFSIDRLERIRDMFLFSCYTGLAYKDVVSLRHDDILTIGDGKWIRKKRAEDRYRI